jgi:predicted ATPase
MIRSLYIDNFKSLVDFRLPPVPHALGPFVCLVGLNGAGKSTVLQALDFLGHLAQGKVKDFLERREWRAADLCSQFTKRQVITFRVEFEFTPLGTVVWEGVFNTKQLRCTAETIAVVGGDTVLGIGDQKLRARMVPPKDGVAPLTRIYDLPGLQYEGSTLSLLKSGQWDTAIESVRDSAELLKSLDMLSPQSMRRKEKVGTDIGYGGERLSAYLHGMNKEAKDRLQAALRDFYPQVQGISTRALSSGVKELGIAEQYLDASHKPLDVKARHINDGLLRMLAVLCQVQASGSLSWQQVVGTVSEDLPVGCVLFDEIENGINPELMDKLVAHLLKAGPQIIVTTHSPLILNYLPDAVAHQAVILLYRNAAGHTRAVRLFDLPSVASKLDLLGPGEAYVDTDLTQLPSEAMALEAAGVEDAL